MTNKEWTMTQKEMQMAAETTEEETSAGASFHDKFGWHDIPW
jgi:hypothetical protein